MRSPSLGLVLWLFTSVGLLGPARAQAQAGADAFYAPPADTRAGLPADGIYPRGRKLAFMGYSGNPGRDLTNGFTFGVNAAGAQWDGLLYEGGKANLSWDNKWTSAVKSYPDRYELEIAIPFKSIRYKKGITRWGVNFSRLDLKTTEKSSWTPISRHFPTISFIAAA